MYSGGAAVHFIVNKAMWVPCIVLGCSAYLNMGFLSYLPWSVSYLVFTLYILYSVLNVSIFINSWDIFLGLSLICSSLYIYSLLCVECFNLYINLAFLFVCLYPINVKTAEPIRPKFCVWPNVALEKVYEWSKFKKFASIKNRFSLNFWKFWKSTKFFVEIS